MSLHVIAGAKTRLFSLFFPAIFVILAGAIQAQVTLSNPSFSSEKLLSLESYQVAGTASASNSRLFLSQKKGVIDIDENGTPLSTQFLDIRHEVNGDGNRGVIASSFDRNFSRNSANSLISTLTFANSSGIGFSNSVQEMGGTPFTATISNPVVGAKYNVGEIVAYSGTAIDSKLGQFTNNSLEWTILLHHGDHVQTVQQTSGPTGSFTVEDHSSVAYYYYELILTATDSSGLKDTKNRFIYVYGTTGVIQGQVVDARTNRGVSKVMVSYSGGRTETDADGNFFFLHVQPGNYTLTPTRPGWLPNSKQSLVAADGVTTTRIAITPAGKIAGLLKDALTGASIPNAVVTISGGAVPTKTTVFTNSSGNYQTDWIGVGDYNISVNLSSYNSAQNAVTVTAGVTSHSNFQLTNGTGACTLSVPGALICEPTNGSIVGSHIRFRGSAYATPGHQISAFWVYVDNVLVHRATTNVVDTTLDISPGTHNIRVQAWDGAGKLFQANSGIKVSPNFSPSSPATPPLIADEYLTCDGLSDDSAKLNSLLEKTQDRTVVLSADKTCGLGSQVTINRPLRFLLYGQLKAVTTGTAGTPLLRVRSSNVEIDCAGTGGIDGDNTQWNGFRVEGDSGFLNDSGFTGCFAINIAPQSTQAEAFGLHSVQKGYIRNVRLENVGVTTNTAGGGFGINLQFCQGCEVVNPEAKDVGSSCINISAGVENKILRAVLTRCTLFALKGGYGLAEPVSGHLAPSRSSFTVEKTNLSSRSLAVGQYFMVIHSPSEIYHGYIKAITEFADYYDVQTTKMNGIPAPGDPIELPDTGTLIKSPFVYLTTADAIDFNISKKITLRNVRCVLAGMYSGAGGVLDAQNSCIWIGADPQNFTSWGPIHPFSSDGITIDGVITVQTGGSGTVVFESDNVKITNVTCTDYDLAGFDPDPLSDPNHYCVEVGRLGYNRHSNVFISNVSADSDKGGIVLANYTRNTVVSHVRGRAASGVKMQAQVAGKFLDSTLEATAPNAIGFEIGDRSRVNPTSGVYYRGLKIGCVLFSCIPFVISDPKAELLENGGENLFHMITTR